MLAANMPVNPLMSFTGAHNRRKKKYPYDISANNGDNKSFYDVRLWQLFVFLKQIDTI